MPDRHRLALWVLAFAFLAPSYAASPVVERLLSRNLNDRETGLDELRSMPRSERALLVPELVSGLGAADAVEASWASDALKVIGPDAVPAMVDFMGSSESGTNFAVMALASMQSTAVPALK